MADLFKEQREHYVPGTIVSVPYWKTFDYVHEFVEADGGWYVIVQEVDFNNNNEWQFKGSMRSHFTEKRKESFNIGVLTIES